MTSRQVDQDLKNELILKKEIRQSTTQMLRRPSYFQKEGVSPTLLTALLRQREEGKLEASALHTWVERFEKDFTECQRKSGELSEESVEAQFQALHAELMGIYESAGLNNGNVAKPKTAAPTRDYKQQLDELLSLPTHQPLDSSPAKHKLKLRRAQTNNKGKDKVGVEASTPKLGSRFQASNATRDLITKTCAQPTNQKTIQPRTKPANTDFRLGKEPDVVAVTQGDTCRAELSSPKSFARPDFVRKITDSLERRNNKPSLRETVGKNEEFSLQAKAPRRQKHREKDRAPNPFADYEEFYVATTTSSTTTSSAAPIGVNATTTRFIPDASSTTASADDWSEPDLSTLKSKKKSTGPKAPFEKFQNCLFSTFTMCAPWCIMKKVYWKRDTTSEEIFAVNVRRNSRVRRSKIKN